MNSFTIDCTRCPRRRSDCDDCLVGALYSPSFADDDVSPPGGGILTVDEQHAAEILLHAGLLTAEGATDFWQEAL